MLAKLTENEQKSFKKVYKRHVNAMGSEQQKKYGREGITKVEKDFPNQPLISKPMDINK